VTDESRPVDGRAVIRVEMPRPTETRRPEIRHHSADRQSGDVTRRPVGLRVVIGREPEVYLLSYCYRLLLFVVFSALLNY